MHITVFCPHCQSRYHLDPSLRGKRMRCPNVVCRSVFEVREAAGDQAAVAMEDDQDSFAELLGVPPEQATATSPDEVDTAPSIEAQAGAWDAPPIRGAAASRQPDAGVVSPVESEPAPPALPRPNWRKLRIAVMVAMLITLAGAAVSGYLVIQIRNRANEELRYQKALEFYSAHNFEDARKELQKLVHDFPASANRKTYDFLVEWSTVREAAYNSASDPEELSGAFSQAAQFLEIYKNDPLLKEYHGDIWQTFQRLARDLTALAEQKQNPAYLLLARRSKAEADKFTPPASAKADETLKSLNDEMVRVGKLLETRSVRLKLMEFLRGLATRGSAQAVQNAHALVKKAGLEEDPEATPLLEAVEKAHRKQIFFKPAKRNSLPDSSASVMQDDPFPSLYVAPAMVQHTTRTVRRPERDLLEPPGRHVVFALVRGILYALDAEQGDVLWVRRVGIDSCVLPARAAASLYAPELIFVVSSDSAVVSGIVAATGAVLWEHKLTAVCLGQPVLVGGHLLLPTVSGEIEEIETSGGTLQGTYTIDQPLLVGGVRQPGTTLVYFPADDYAVYCLDIAKRVCAGILYTGHASGSLHGPPLVWQETSPGEDKSSGWLLLSVSSGNDTSELLPFSVPFRNAHQKPARPRVKLKGEAWFSPWQDAGRLALATDAGVLGLYGIREKGNRDPLLFSLLSGEYRLENDESAHRARAQLVHADAQNYWVASGGKLHRLESTFTSASGPGLVARWPGALEVGSPVHESQIHVAAEGRKMLILVTHELDSPKFSARAIDAQDGRVIWQRQLGIVCQSQPIASSGAVLCDAAAGSFLFQAAGVPRELWQNAGALINEAPSQSRRWFSRQESRFVELSWGAQTQLALSLISSAHVVTRKTFALPALPQGTPCLRKDFVLLPLANGSMARVPLEGDNLVLGPDWRGVGVDESHPGYVVARADDDFIVSDGGRSLARLHWSDPKTWEKTATAELPHRITSSPVTLNGRVLVADASDTITLFDETLTAVRRWPLGGKITAGPFVRAQGVGVIVGKNRLICLDPDKDQPAWEYSFVAPVVGEPELIENMIVVADLQGAFTALDPVTGKPIGPGYRLKANEAATAAPVPFGPGQLFVPLMDGTVMILPLEKLR